MSSRSERARSVFTPVQSSLVMDTLILGYKSRAIFLNPLTTLIFPKILTPFDS